MTSRLLLRYGLVAAHDRLSGSADTVLVTEPATGSKSRTKGNLYLVVSVAGMGGRARDATALVADTIRRDYYYDESAGIAVCLQKAFRSASRRLRTSREGHGVAAGSIGAAVAVIRGNELYVATIGDAEAYLVRAARLLMPEHEPGEGLPTTDGVRLDVWRGELAVGDSLLLVARSLTEVVGTEELKNAVVTLHPQSAVEHLHHLFVAAGGEGSDGVLAIEASESSGARLEHRLVPVASPDPYASGTGGSPIPLVDQMVGAAAAVQGRAIQAREAVGNAFFGMVDRVLDVMPHRPAAYRHIAPTASRRETQRRAAVAFLSFLGVTLVLGLAAWLFPRATEDPITRTSAGEAAFVSAERKVNLVLGVGNLFESDPGEAVDLLREAWAELETAEDTGVPASRVRSLRGRVASGLDPLYGVAVTEATPVAALPDGAAPQDLAHGPDGAAYVLDGEARSVTRVHPTSGQAVVIVTAGDGPGEGIGAPDILAVGGPDVLIIDDRGALWRWRPSDDRGGGTLAPVRLGGEVAWGDDVADVATYLVDSERGLYNLYVADPSSRQILRYQPVADGSGFSAPNGYLAIESDDVAEFRQLYIDGDLYALTEQGLVKYVGGNVRDMELDELPDDGDIRPGHQYGLMAATGPRNQGDVYVWDALHRRIAVFGKGDGTYLRQYVVEDAGGLADVRGMYLVEDAEGAPPTMFWVTADGVWRSVLDVVEPVPEETPVVTGSPVPGASPGAGGPPAASAAPAEGGTP